MPADSSGANDAPRTGGGGQLAAPDMESDELFRLLVDSVRDYAIFMLDPAGRVASWNTGAQFMKGYLRHEIIGRHFSVFYPAEAVDRKWPEHELECARKDGRFEDEGWRVRKDGTTFWANVVITAVRDDDRRLRGFAKVTRDLTARREAEALQRSEQQMNEFLAMLAHELRNPLAPIQSALDVVERKPDDIKAATWARHIIRRQAEQLSRLVDDLLDVSRITRGAITPRRESVDIKATIGQLVESIQPTLTARRHHLEVSLSDAPIAVHADGTRVAQVIANLLGNAAKYTHDGGTLRIRAEAANGWARVTVSDNGIGMPADLVPRVFDLFVQGERGLDRREGGLGVGLTLAKRLVELQGGTLSAASAGPGRGSEFTLSMPLEATLQHAASTPSQPASAGAPKAQRVMIVDDNEDAATAMAALVEVMGHQTVVLHDGRSALAAAIVERPDLMLLDIGLPGMDGFEVARRLRQTPGLERLRLVACTGYGQAEDARKIREAGFNRHLVKPISVADLESVLTP